MKEPSVSGHNRERRGREKRERMDIEEVNDLRQPSTVSPMNKLTDINGFTFPCALYDSLWHLYIDGKLSTKLRLERSQREKNSTKLSQSM